ncbi:MAG: Ca2+-binding RTX toxin-like protein, partial [Paracoccaceae bacterium]
MRSGQVCTWKTFSGLGLHLMRIAIVPPSLPLGGMEFCGWRGQHYATAQEIRMTANFVNPYDADVVGLWDFRTGQENNDTGLDDGIAQDGTPVYDPEFHSGWMVTDGQHTRFGVHGNDDPFDLTEGTIVTEFKEFAHCGDDPNTIVSRGEADAAHEEGFFEIRVTADGAVEVFHADGHQVSEVSTGPGFLGVNDVVTVSYSWSAAKGTQLLVENTTQGTTATDSSDVLGLTLDVTENDGESFSIAARESTDGDYDQHFNGCVNYVAVLDKPVIGLGDGIVSGSAGGDLIDLAYTGDPEGDMIDAGDALLPGEAADDDIVDAQAGDDVIKAGVGDDDVYAGSGSDTVYGESGDDVIWGDSNAPGGTVTPVRESFEWDLAPDPDGSGDVDNGDDLSGGFTQNTGT